MAAIRNRASAACILEVSVARLGRPRRSACFASDGAAHSTGRRRSLVGRVTVVRCPQCGAQMDGAQMDGWAPVVLNHRGTGREVVYPYVCPRPNCRHQVLYVQLPESPNAQSHPASRPNAQPPAERGLKKLAKDCGEPRRGHRTDVAALAGRTDASTRWHGHVETESPDERDRG